MKAGRSRYRSRCAPSGGITGPRRGGHQAQLDVSEIAVITLFIGNAYQISPIVDGPGMVEILGGLAGAFVMPAHHGSPVGSTVREYPRPIVPDPGKERGATDHVALLVLSRLFHFGLVAKVAPAPVENPLLIQFGYRGEVIAERWTLNILWSRSSIIRSSIPIGNPATLSGQAYIYWIRLSTFRGWA